MHITDLKTRIDTQTYVVDPRLVADAVIRRGLLGLRLPPISAGDARIPPAPALPPYRPPS